MKNCVGKWIKKIFFGFCEKDSRWSWVTFCGEDYSQGSSFTLNNGHVLCLVKTARREVTITHVDDLNSANVLTKPDSMLQGI